MTFCTVWVPFCESKLRHNKPMFVVRVISIWNSQSFSLKPSDSEAHQNHIWSISSKLMPNIWRLSYLENDKSPFKMKACIVINTKAGMFEVLMRSIQSLFNEQQLKTGITGNRSVEHPSIYQSSVVRSNFKIFENSSSKDILEGFSVWSVFDNNWFNRISRQKSLAI